MLSISGNKLTIKELTEYIKNKNSKITIAPQSLKQVDRAHSYLIRQINNSIIYGVNTGFGPMASHILGNDQINALQINLIRSHAVGVGAPIDPNFVLAAMIIRLNMLSKGSSGVSVKLINHLALYINKRIIPIVPEHGAVGTSGDLVQLAHIALALIGEGEVFYKNKKSPTAAVLKKLGIKPYVLKPKEGLALINGTAMMTGIAAIISEKAQKLINLSSKTSAIALELIQGFDDSISPLLHRTRPHNGQMIIAEHIGNLLRTSKLLRQRVIFQKNHPHHNGVKEIPETVQEIYSFRCVPQILGPIYDTLQSTIKVVEIEANSVTDNPIIDVSHNKILHGGNFHGDYIAASIDQLKMTLVKLTMLSERRINFFLNNKINKIFPPFLNLLQPGLTLALQGIQFVATSTTAQSQTLAFPQYVHSIPTNGDNQDIVSMGTDAALLASKVVDNAFVVLSIELIVLCQAIDCLKIQKKLALPSQKLYNFIRKNISVIYEDRPLTSEVNKLIDQLKNTSLTNELE